VDLNRQFSRWGQHQDRQPDALVPAALLFCSRLVCVSVFVGPIEGVCLFSLHHVHHSRDKEGLGLGLAVALQCGGGGHGRDKEGLQGEEGGRRCGADGVLLQHCNNTVLVI